MESPRDKPATPTSRLEKDFFQAAFDQSAVATAVISQAGVFLRVNAAFSEFVGRGSPELVGRRWADVLHPDDVAASAAACDRALHGEASSLRLEQRYLHQDGRVLWGDVNASLVGDGRGGAQHFFAQILDVTERWQLADAQRTTQYYQRALLDNFPYMVWLKDANSRLLAVNQAYADACGAACPEDLLGKTDLDLWPKDLAQRYRADDQEVLRTRQKKSVEEPIEDQGVRKWFETYKAPVEDAGGTLHGTVGFARDITERKRNEELLRQQVDLEKLLTRLVEVTPGSLGTYQLMPDGTARVPYASPSHAEVIGLSPQELTNDTAVLLRYIHLDDVSQYLESFKESARTLSAWCGEFRLCHPVKGEVWIEGQSMPERQPDGSIVWYGFMHDVTERKRAERLLRAREQEFRTLVEHLPDMIVRLDRDCRRVFVNPAYERETGIPLDQVLYSTFDEVWWPTMPHEDYKARLQQVMETGVPDQIFLEMPRPDGQIASYEVHVVAEHDENGQSLGTLAIGRNITALKQAERELSESRTQIRELAARRESALEEERKRIAREIHDELGQLLSVLHLQVQFLQARFGSTDPLIEEKSREIMNLVDKTQQVARDITSTIRPAALSMGIVAALEWQVETLSRHTGIHGRLRGTENDIQLDEERATAILRIVQESLTNVMRHSSASEVEVLLEQRDDSYALHIWDNGAGFDPDKTMAKKSFGLIGIRERALMLGGDVAITSAPQQGTLLQVRFPVQKRQETSRHDSCTDSR